MAVCRMTRGSVDWSLCCASRPRLSVRPSFLPSFMPSSSSSSVSVSVGRLPNVLVTGTPGCGKSSLCGRLSELSGLRHIDVGLLVRDRGLHSGWDEQHAAFTLDDDRLCECLEAELADGGCIVDFHSTSTFPVRWFELVVVLRCSTHTLYERLQQRGYSAAKIDENMECEIMQVCLDEAMEGWGGSEHEQQQQQQQQRVLELHSDTVEQMDSNAERCALWLRQWQAEHAAQSKLA